MNIKGQIILPVLELFGQAKVFFKRRIVPFAALCTKLSRKHLMVLVVGPSSCDRDFEAYSIIL